MSNHKSLNKLLHEAGYYNRTEIEKLPTPIFIPILVIMNIAMIVIIILIAAGVL